MVLCERPEQISTGVKAVRSKLSLFSRHENNPILSSDYLDIDAFVFNPGVVQFNEKTLLLLRVEGADGHSNIHLAKSKDGISKWQVNKKPFLGVNSKYKYEEWGCEDARVVCVDDNGMKYYITYTAYSHHGPCPALAVTEDFRAIERLGLILPPYNKDVVLFPEKVNCQWWLLHRPYAAGEQNIWLASSSDILNWGNHRCLIEKGKGGAWDCLKVGAGPPPIKTEAGWLVIYHGVREVCNTLIYKTGMVLLDLNDLSRIVKRLRFPVFEASIEYEMKGNVPNVVFPTGTIVKEDILYLYYGASDASVCLATARMSDILSLFA